jgi:transposase-like protein
MGRMNYQNANTRNARFDHRVETAADAAAGVRSGTRIAQSKLAGEALRAMPGTIEELVERTGQSEKQLQWALQLLSQRKLAMKTGGRWSKSANTSRRFTIVDGLRWRDEYEQQLKTIEQIGLDHDVSTPTVRNWLIKAGTTMRTPGEGNRLNGAQNPKLPKAARPTGVHAHSSNARGHRRHGLV